VRGGIIRSFPSAGGLSTCHHKWVLLDAEQEQPWPEQAGLDEGLLSLPPLRSPLYGESL
jgi:hypothetical protein